MTHLQLNQELLATLKDKVVVLTGGATGIGRATVEQFNSKANPMSAYLNIRLIPYREWSPGRLGDVNDGVAHQGASKLGAGAYFVHCDTSYSDQLTLFTTAEKVFHRVDIVVANASIAHHKDIFAPDQDVSREPSMAEIDVNTKGTLFTTRIGILYLRKYGGGDIVLVSSIAVFKESGGVATYTASKHGVIGLMRGLHLTASPENIRINVLVKGIEDGSYRLNLPTNEPDDVARAVVLCATPNRGDSGQSHINAGRLCGSAVVRVMKSKIGSKR